MKINLFISPQTLPLWPLPDKDARKTLQARAFLTRLKKDMGMDMVDSIYKKAMRLARVQTKAKPETGGWIKTLHRITGPLGRRVVRI